LQTCAPADAWLSVINGRTIVEQGEIVDLDVDTLVQQHNQHAQRLLHKAAAKGNYHD